MDTNLAHKIWHTCYRNLIFHFKLILPERESPNLWLSPHPGRCLIRMCLKQICWPGRRPEGVQHLLLDAGPQAAHYPINSVVVKTGWNGTHSAPGMEQAINKFMNLLIQNPYHLLTKPVISARRDMTIAQSPGSNSNAILPAVPRPLTSLPPLLPGLASCCTATSLSCSKLLICTLTLSSCINKANQSPNYLQCFGYAQHFCSTPAATHAWKQPPHEFLPL